MAAVPPEKAVVYLPSSTLIAVLEPGVAVGSSVDRTTMPMDDFDDRPPGSVPWPVTVGIPFANGALTSGRTPVILAGGNIVPSKATTALNWRHGAGTPSWVHSDFQIDMGGDANDPDLSFFIAPTPSHFGPSVTVTESATKYTIATGAITFECSKTAFNLFDTLSAGATQIVESSQLYTKDAIGVIRDSSLQVDSVVVEKSGQMEAILCYDVSFKAAGSPAKHRCKIRVYAFAGLSYVKLETRLIWTENLNLLVSINTDTDVLTTITRHQLAPVAHGWSTGDVVRWKYSHTDRDVNAADQVYDNTSSTGQTVNGNPVALPTVSGTALDRDTDYYIRLTSAYAFTLHRSYADSQSGANPINFTNQGLLDPYGGRHYLQTQAPLMTEWGMKFTLAQPIVSATAGLDGDAESVNITTAGATDFYQESRSLATIDPAVGSTITGTLFDGYVAAKFAGGSGLAASVYKFNERIPKVFTVDGTTLTVKLWGGDDPLSMAEEDRVADKFKYSYGAAAGSSSGEAYQKEWLSFSGETNPIGVNTLHDVWVWPTQSDANNKLINDLVQRPPYPCVDPEYACSTDYLQDVRAASKTPAEHQYIEDGIENGLLYLVTKDDAEGDYDEWNHGDIRLFRNGAFRNWDCGGYNVSALYPRQFYRTGKRHCIAAGMDNIRHTGSVDTRAHVQTVSGSSTYAPRVGLAHNYSVFHWAWTGAYLGIFIDHPEPYLLAWLLTGHRPSRDVLEMKCATVIASGYDNPGPGPYTILDANGDVTTTREQYGKCNFLLTLYEFSGDVGFYNAARNWINLALAAQAASENTDQLPDGTKLFPNNNFWGFFYDAFRYVYRHDSDETDMIEALTQTVSDFVDEGDSHYNAPSWAASWPSPSRHGRSTFGFTHFAAAHELTGDASYLQCPLRTIQRQCRAVQDSADAYDGFSSLQVTFPSFVRGAQQILGRWHDLGFPAVEWLGNMPFIASRSLPSSAAPWASNATLWVNAMNTNPSGLPTIAIDTLTYLVTSGNQDETAAAGGGTPGATLSLVVTDNAGAAIAPVTGTVASNGRWSITDIDVSTMRDGLLTYTVTATVDADSASDSLTTTKETGVHPISVTITSATNPINDSLKAAVSVSGIGDNGADLLVTATDGTLTTDAEEVTIAGGSWSVTLDVTALADGSITINVAASDVNGNVGSASTTVTKDTVAPTVIITLVTPTTLNAANAGSVVVSGLALSGAVQVIVHATDSSGGSTSNYTATFSPPVPSFTATIDTTGLADGAVTIHATGTDSAGNSRAVVYVLTKDTVAPAVAFSPNPSNITNANKASLSAAGTGEEGAGISVVITDSVLQTTAATTTVSSGVWSVSGINATTLADGPVDYVVTATDAAGNIATQRFTATKSVTGPTVVITVVNSDNIINNANKAATTATGTVTAGAASVSVTGTDGVHTTTPVLAVITGTTWTASGIDATSLTDGAVTFNAVATDSLGNTGSDGQAVTKDVAAPSIAITSTNPTTYINNSNKASVSVTGTCSTGTTITVVATNGAETTALYTAIRVGTAWTCVGINTTGLSDGTITFTATATDDAGNATAVQVTRTKDVVPPTVDATSATDPINSGNHTNVTVSGTGTNGNTVTVRGVSGATQGPLSSPVTVSGGTWSVTGYDASTLPDGSVVFTATATDTAGNTGTDTITVTKGASSAPTVSAFYPVNAATGVASRDIFQLTFSQDMDPATITHESVLLLDDNDDPVRTRYPFPLNLMAAQSYNGSVYTDETEYAKNLTSGYVQGEEMVIMQASPAVGHAYVWGADRPFARLELWKNVTGSGTWTITYEYWNGSSWSALSNVVDGTGNYRTANPGAMTGQSVSWDPPTDWVANTLNGKGPYYYVRARVSAFTSMSTRPRGMGARVQDGLDYVFYDVDHKIATIETFRRLEDDTEYTLVATTDCENLGGTAIATDAEASFTTAAVVDAADLTGLPTNCSLVTIGGETALVINNSTGTAGSKYVYTLPSSIRFAGTGIYATQNYIRINLNGHIIYFGGNNDTGNYPYGDTAGVVIGSNTGLFTELSGVSIPGPGTVSAPSGCEVIGGTIVGEGNALCQHGIRHYANGCLVNNMRIDVDGIDSAAIFTHYGGTLTVSNSVLTCRGTDTLNRHDSPANIWSRNTDSLTVSGCVMVGGMAGVTPRMNGVVSGNVIAQACFQTDGYGVVFYWDGTSADGGNGCTVTNNLIVPLNGRGVLNGRGKNNSVTNNVMLALERKNREFGAALNATAIRCRYSADLNTFTGNTCLSIGAASSDPSNLTGASGLYLTDTGSNMAGGTAVNTFTGNSFTTILIGATSLNHYAVPITLEGQGVYASDSVAPRPASDVMANNVCRSNLYQISTNAYDGVSNQATPITGNSFYYVDGATAVDDWYAAALAKLTAISMHTNRYAVYQTALAGHFVSSLIGGVGLNANRKFWKIQQDNTAPATGEYLTHVNSTYGSGVDPDTWAQIAAKTGTVRNLRGRLVVVKLVNSSAVPYANTTFTIQTSFGDSISYYQLKTDASGVVSLPVIESGIDKASISSATVAVHLRTTTLIFISPVAQVTKTNADLLSHINDVLPYAITL